MTSFGTSSFCALCGKQSGSTSCDGCQRKFCFECLSEHRRELSLEFDELINRRNELFETINNHASNNTTGKCSCFDEIDRWQTEMRANVDRIALTARDNVRQFLSEASKNVRNELDQVSKDLQQRQKTGGYVEGDLNRIKQQLTKLNDAVQRFNEQIHIDTSTSKRIDWDSLLFVVPNGESQINTMPTIVSQTPNSNTFPNQRAMGRVSMPNHQSYPDTASSQPPPYPVNNQWPSYPNATPSTSTSYSSSNQRPSQSIPYPVSNQRPSYPNATPSTSTSYSSNNRTSSLSNTMPPPSTPYPTSNHRASGRSASVSMGSRPVTYTCIGCKTTNQINENGRNFCSVCRSPAPF